MKPDPTATVQSYTEALAYNSSPSPDATLAESQTPRRDRYLGRLRPLDVRLAEKLRDIPDEVKQNGMHMDDIWPLALGRQREKPRAFEVAAALRLLSWQRVRYYQDSAPSTTLWFPPEVTQQDAKAAMKGRTV